MFSHLRWQDGTVCVALITYRFEYACESPERLFSKVLDPYKLICITMLSDKPKWDFLINSLLPYLDKRSSLMKTSMLYTPLVRFAYYANILEGLASYPLSACRHFLALASSPVWICTFHPAYNLMQLCQIHELHEIHACIWICLLILVSLGAAAGCSYYFSSKLT